jgi:hypothetical protein
LTRLGSGKSIILQNQNQLKQNKKKQDLNLEFPNCAFLTFFQTKKIMKINQQLKKISQKKKL